MTLLSLAFRNLVAHPLRTAATLAGVALAVASFVALVGLARGLEHTLRGALEARGTDLVMTEAGAGDLLSSIVSEDTARRVAVVPGVAATAAELARMTSLENGAPVLVVGWHPGGFPWDTLVLRDGRLPAPGERGTAAVGSSLAERRGLRTGDTLRLFQEEFRIVGIVGSDSLLTRNLVFVPLADAQALTFRQGQASSVNLRLDRGITPEARAGIVAAVRAAVPEVSVEETGTIMQDQVFARVADVLSWAISLVALLGAVFTVLNTMSMAVNERRGEIAILGAFGWSQPRIVIGILAEGFLLAGLAGALGAALGAAVAHAVASSPSVAGFILPAIGPALIGQAVLIALLLGLAGSLLPALKASATSPADVLRGR
jgi:putative ABC transport system permease protein